LIEVIGNFRREYPDTTNFDIRQAINLAMNEGRTRNQAVMIAVLALMMGLGVLMFFFASRHSQFGNQMMIPVILIAAGIFIVILTALRRNK
jgi:hypothetical protein